MLDDQWLAERLVAEGLATQAQIDRARDAPDLCRGLISTGAVEEPALLRFLGLHHQTRYVSTEKLSSAKVVQWVLDLMDLEFCEKYQVLPIRCDKQRTTLSVVTPDPSDQELIQEAKNKSGIAEISAYVALPHAIEAGIRKFYRGDLHAFARMDQSLRQNYSEMLNIYEQRLIDFEGEEGSPPDVQSGTPQTFKHDELVLEDPDRADAPQSAPTPAAPAGPAATTSPTPSRPSPAAQPAPLQLTGMPHVVQVVVGQLEQPHGWRAGHSTEVARLVGQLCTKADLPPAATEEVQLAALLHELGKPFDFHLTLLSIEASDAMRRKAAELYQTPAQLLGAAGLAAGVEKALSSLYERADGKGVPGQLSGDKVPLGARLVQVADAYCDLISNPDAPGGRCPPDTALGRLEDAAGRGLLDSATVGHLSALQQTAAGPRGDRPLVLIIDEDARSAALLEAQLKSSGFDAVVANTTGDAALVLLGEAVSLVLSEVDLKPMDGFTFLEWLRSNQRTSDIPFMFVSGRTGADDVNRGFELGALDYIVKPFRPEVVLAKIKRTVPGA